MTWSLRYSIPLYSEFVPGNGIILYLKQYIGMGQKEYVNFSKAEKLKKQYQDLVL